MLVALTLHNESRTKCERVWRPATADHLANRRDSSPAKGLVLITSATLSAPRRSVSYSGIRRVLRPNPARFAYHVCGFRMPSARNDRIAVKQLTMSTIVVNPPMALAVMAFCERVFLEYV